MKDTLPPKRSITLRNLCADTAAGYLRAGNADPVQCDAENAAKPQRLLERTETHMNNNPNGAKKSQKTADLLLCCHAARAYDAQLAAVSELAAAAGDRGRLRRVHLHGGQGQVETIAYDKQNQEITFEAKNDKGKDALYKTGIFPDDELVGRLLGPMLSLPLRSRPRPLPC